MINYLNTVLDYLLKSQVSLLRSDNLPTIVDGQVSFQPPNEDWRSRSTNLGARKALDVYLFDLRENRKLRSNERSRDIQNGIVVESPAAARVDCHYLISAWSPTTEDQGKTLEEHALLQQVTGILMNNQPLVPRRVFGTTPPPPSFPVGELDVQWPTTILPHEGFPKLAEFWGTMGNPHPWKPVVYLIVTIPIKLAPIVAGPLVTTRITEYRQAGNPETADTWIQISGSVLEGSPPTPVPGAWVQLETPSGTKLQTTETDAQGRFTFSNLKPGQYQLHARALEKDVTIPTDVPSPTGNYDINLS